MSVPGTNKTQVSVPGTCKHVEETVDIKQTAWRSRWNPPPHRHPLDPTLLSLHAGLKETCVKRRSPATCHGGCTLLASVSAPLWSLCAGLGDRSAKDVYPRDGVPALVWRGRIAWTSVFMHSMALGDPAKRLPTQELVSTLSPLCAGLKEPYVKRARREEVLVHVRASCLAERIT